MACDPAQLLLDAECIRCNIPPGAMPAVYVSLLCQLAGGTTTGPYVLKTGDTMTGSLVFSNVGTNNIQVPFVWARFADANNNTFPALIEAYHEVSGGVGGGANNCGVSIDFRTDDATTDRQAQVRLFSVWTNSAHATATAQFRIQTALNAVLTTFLSVGNTLVDAQNGAFFGVAGTQVVGARNTGWTTFTGASTKNAGGFDTGTVTTAQLASVVKAMFDAMVTHGLIGP